MTAVRMFVINLGKIFKKWCEVIENNKQSFHITMLMFWSKLSGLKNKRLVFYLVTFHESLTVYNVFSEK